MNTIKRWVKAYCDYTFTSWGGFFISACITCFVILGIWLFFDNLLNTRDCFRKDTKTDVWEYNRECNCSIDLEDYGIEYISYTETKKGKAYVVVLEEEVSDDKEFYYMFEYRFGGGQEDMILYEDEYGNKEYHRVKDEDLVIKVYCDGVRERVYRFMGDAND